MRTSGRTGEKVREAGTYKNAFGKQVRLEADMEFPPCPKEGKSITWERVD